MAAANAQIGIANAAFYPSFTLGATLGAETRYLPALYDMPSLIWSAAFITSGGLAHTVSTGVLAASGSPLRS